MPSGRFTFAGVSRLRLKRDFDRVFKVGKAFHTSRVNVLFTPNKMGHNRLGLVVKKTTTSVARNRTRRLLREAFRLAAPEMKQGFDVVLIPRRGARYELDALQADLLQALGPAK